jgi:hypothetical protein
MLPRLARAHWRRRMLRVGAGTFVWDCLFSDRRPGQMIGVPRKSYSDAIIRLARGRLLEAIARGEAEKRR